MEDLVGPVEEGAWSPWAPGASHQGAEVSVGKEIEEVAGGVPDGSEAVDPVTGDLGPGALPGTVELDLGEGVDGGFLIGNPTTVRGPAHSPHPFLVLGDQGLLARPHVQDPEVPVVVGVGRPAPVRGGMALEAEDGAVVGEGRLLSYAVRRQRHPFKLPALVREAQEAFPVGHEGHVPVTDSVLHRGLDQPTTVHRRHEDPPPGGNNHAFALGVKVDGVHVRRRVVHPLFPELIEIRGQSDRNESSLVCGDVIEPQVGSQLIDDPPLIQLRVLHVPARMEGVLADVVPVFVHGPEVHSPVPIRDEVDSSLPDHWRVALAVIVTG